MKTSYLLIAFLLFITYIGCDSQTGPESEMIWPLAKIEHRPGTYWWWMGSAVDAKNITYNLENLNDAGIGGVTIVPIYGVMGEEERFIDYLNPDWMTMLAHTVREADRLGMWVDMTTGTGWPFGGSHVTPEHAAKKIEHKILPVKAGERIVEKVNRSGWMLILALSDHDETIQLSDNVNTDDYLVWTAPPGQWKIYILWQAGTGQKVKRAAPGNQGLVLDPFSVSASDFYLQRFDMAFENYDGPAPRAQYHDSYEYYHANWTDDFLQEFKERRGYDLIEHLPLLFGNGDVELVGRVKADYRQTLAELHRAYIENWVDWSHKIGSLTRDQAHGAPGNLLDLYATADIPETEIFGSTPFNIPGLRRLSENIGKDAPNPLVLQFSSSAGHVTGKNLIASETCTWLRDHYKTALSQVKPEIDQLFLAGINHIFYHGNAYTPAEAEWPGWLFYASTHFEKENSIWRDIPALNNYVRRCQSVLQSGTPANDILLYWPVYDIWQNPEGMEQKLTVHSIDWFTETPFGRLANYLKSHGYTFDYISDNQLKEAKYKKGNIHLPGGSYRTILVPESKYMPLHTWFKLLDLAKNGATIIFDTKLPLDVPGYSNYKERHETLVNSLCELNFDTENHKNEFTAPVGDGRLILGDNNEKLLSLAGISAENIVDKGVGFIRRKHENGYYYFLANLSEHTIDGWVSMSAPFVSALVLDPNTGDYGTASIRNKQDKSEVYLQMQPGESLILKTYTDKDIKVPFWKYLSERKEVISFNSNWQVDFIEGGPVLPESFSTDELISWTDFPDKETKRFAGTARYSATFQLPDHLSDDWILDLGVVFESARIRINGNDAGTLWSIPFRLPVGKYLRKGMNTLEIEVINLAANRIKAMDERKVSWKIFHEINFVNIDYKKFDASIWPLMPSGLIGPVKLISANLLEF